MRTLLFALAAAGGLAIPSLAAACSCAPPPPPSVALAQSGVVFEGTVIGVPGDAPAGSPQGGVNQVEYRFSVARHWKGSPGQEVRVFTNAHGAACGRTYEQGSTYLVYAQMSDEATIHDSICSRTRLTKGATVDFAALGEGLEPRRRGGAKGTVTPPAEEPTDGGGVEPDPAPGAAEPAGDAGDGAADAGAADGGAAEPADAPKTEPAEPKAAEPKAEPATEDPVEQDDLDKKSCAMSGPADASALGLLALAGIAGIRRRR